MSRPAADKDGTARVAIVGAEAPDGTTLRKALADAGVPGSRVNLYGSTTGDLLISEYAGEARMIQEPRIDEIVAHDLVLLCEKSRLSRDVSEAATPAVLIIDVVGCLDRHPRIPLVQADINPELAREHNGVLSVPHPLAGILAEVLHPLENGLGLREVIAVILRPAADFGEEGLDELRSQTVDLLNFEKVQIKTFGKQLAFNLLPGAPEAEGATGVEARVEEDVARLLGWNENRIAVRSVIAPIFYGHCLQLRFRLNNGCGLSDVQSILSEMPFCTQAEADRQVSPLEASTEKGIRMAPVVEDGLGGFWLWAVSGELAERRAEQVLKLAGSLSPL